MVSEDIEMSRIPREEVDQEMETANERMPNTDQDEEKEILISWVSRKWWKCLYTTPSEEDD